MRDRQPPPSDTTVVIDHVKRTIRPSSVDADDYFGLALGTNGTAAICRRALVEPKGYRWLRARGAIALGVTLVPTARSEHHYVNPWTGDRVAA